MSYTSASTPPGGRSVRCHKGATRKRPHSGVCVSCKQGSDPRMTSKQNGNMSGPASRSWKGAQGGDHFKQSIYSGKQLGGHNKSTHLACSRIEDRIVNLSKQEIAQAMVFSMIWDCLHDPSTMEESNTSPLVNK